jgi:VIT1/CCC1 family predicted Fe2+/Mn2+ transporter
MSLHEETHVESSAALRDFVIGLSDGLTVPFALAAGLSGAIDSTALIVTAGIAEIAAGAIAMGLGGFLAARTDADHYDSEYRREAREIVEVPHVEEREVAGILREFGVPEAQLAIVTDAIKQHPEKWVNFMMRFELGLEKPDPRRQLVSPLIIGSAYVLGGFIPLMPYLLLKNVSAALPASILVTLAALFMFGAFRGHYTGMPKWRSGFHTALIGALAAAVAYALASLAH